LIRLAMSKYATNRGQASLIIAEKGMPDCGRTHNASHTAENLIAHLTEE
jgi:hypothetical protein